MDTIMVTGATGFGGGGGGGGVWAGGGGGGGGATSGASAGRAWAGGVEVAPFDFTAP